MNRFHIVLTESEQAAVTQIDFHNTGDHDAYLANQRPILALLSSLNERNVVPAHRLRYWSDPAYYSGRLKESHRGVFERNGTKGDRIYIHPHFIPYLRYFLYGPELPDAVIEAFTEEVGNPEWVTSGDITSMCKCARRLVREFRLDKGRVPEEFFKLCLEIGLDLSYAESVRQAVKQVR